MPSLIYGKTWTSSTNDRFLSASDIATLVVIITKADKQNESLSKYEWKWLRSAGLQQDQVWIVWAEITMTAPVKWEIEN